MIPELLTAISLYCGTNNSYANDAHKCVSIIMQRCDTRSSIETQQECVTEAMKTGVNN